MRRTLFTLMLITCFANVISAQVTGRPPDPIENEKKNLIEALKALQAASETEQHGEDAKVLKRDVQKKLAQGFSSDKSLAALTEDIDSWKDRADALAQRGPLFNAIAKVYSVKKEYLAQLNKNNNRPNVPLTQTDPNAKTEPSSPVESNIEGDAKNKPPSSTSVLALWLPFGMMIATPLLALGLFAAAFVAISKTRREVNDAGALARQAVINLKGKQEGFVKQLEGLTESNRDLFARLAELSAEIGALGKQVQMVRGAASATAQPLMPVIAGGDGAAARAPEPPAFPVAADAYLRKMQRYATVVKPDFQNGILIADSENKGELVLVQDASIAHDALFIIPRATQFQMKQDFYTYYERYYDCDRPASGTVWILDPAVVERVQGGWVLREKGVLEVR